MQPELEQPEQEPLPEFRRDLELFEGPPEEDGSRTWSLYDPIRAQYFRVAWKEAMILTYLRPGMTLNSLLLKLEQETTAEYHPDDITVFFEDAGKNLLLQRHRPSEELWDEAKKHQINPIKWVLFHYLYFRVPLFNPTKLIRVTLPFIKPFISRMALTIYMLLSMLGIMLVLTRLDEFLHTFSYFFSMKGILAYMVTIILVKFAHEFAHAYAGYIYGVNVPTIGVAFIVLWPVLYTDVTDSWRLRERKERMAITFSGVVVELVIAGLATFGWAMTNPGVLQSLFFVVSTTTWISSLMVNLNPAMKFDGYYLLSDWWGIDNLQNRSFAIARWKIRQWLFGLKTPPPEEGLSARRQTEMVVYSLLTWSYRVLIYTTIAAVIYFTFTKALGVLLLLITLYTFLVRPIVDEIGRLKRFQGQLQLNVRLVLTGSLAAIFFLWFVMPWPHTNLFPGITSPSQEQVVYVKNPGVVKRIHVKRGDQVAVGDLLVELSWKPLELAIADRVYEKGLLEAQMRILHGGDRQEILPEKQAQLEAIEAQISGMMDRHKQGQLTAQVAGTIYEWDESLKEQQTVATEHVVGKIAPLGSVEAISYVPESYVKEIEEGMEVTFRLNRTWEEVQGVVRSINPVREHMLDFPQLSSANQGPLPTNQDQSGNNILIETYYEVHVELHGEGAEAFKLGQPGELLVSAGWESKLVNALRYIGSIFWQESGF